MAQKPILKVAEQKRTFLWHPMTKKDTSTQIVNVHRFKCDGIECDENKLENLLKPLKEVQGTLKVPSPIHDHQTTTGHLTTVDNFCNLVREEQNLTRTIK